MHASPSGRRTFGQYLLGAFVVWQFAFLFASNIVAFFPHGVPEEGELSDSRSGPAMEADCRPVQRVIDGTSFITDRWAHVTGQVQAWWLFAPSFPKRATFPVVELRWDDTDNRSRSGAVEVSYPPVRLRSVVEPDNPQSY